MVDSAEDLREEDKVMSFEESVEAQLPFLLNSARKILKNPIDAEDLVQETVIRALRFQDKFDGKHLRSWLYTILKRLCINKWNKDSRDRENLKKLKESETYTDITSMTEEEIQADSVRAYIGNAIDQIPEVYRETARLIFLGGLSYQDTADRLDCSIGTVMSRLHRARKLLKPLLDDLRAEYGIVLSGEEDESED